MVWERGPRVRATAGREVVRDEVAGGWTDYLNTTELKLDPRLIQIWRHGRNGDRKHTR